MKIKYFLYTSRVPAAPFLLEAIFNNEENLEKYISEEEEKLRFVSGMQFRCRVDKVKIEE